MTTFLASKAFIGQFKVILRSSPNAGMHGPGCTCTSTCTGTRQGLGLGTLIQNFWENIFGVRNLNGESGKNSKRGTITERVFRKKIHSAALHQFVYVLYCASICILCYGFFQKSRSVTVPKIHGERLSRNARTSYQSVAVELGKV